MSLGQCIAAVDGWMRVHGEKEHVEAPSDEEINEMLIQHGFEPEDNG